MKKSWKTGLPIPVRNKCQFSWYCDGKSDEVKNKESYKKILDFARLMMHNDIRFVDITDGACSVGFTYDASNCGNPCEPTTNNVNLSICAGQSAFLEGADQTEAGTYSEVYVTPQGCDSTVITALTILPHTESSPEYTICTGASITVGTSSYDTEGVYVDTLVNSNGCDSIVTSTLFLLPTITASDEMTICMGTSYD